MSRFLPRIAQFTSHLAKPTTRASVSTTVPQFARKMAPIPASQKVVQITENGPSDVLKVSEAPVPQLKDDQILVRNEFAGVNYIDTYFRSGLYKTDFPLILGREAAGYVVASHPSVKGKFADGAKVVYMAEATYAQYTAVAAKDVIAIPDGVDTDVAVAAFLQGLTALTLVHEAADVQPDQWTYVAAAAGGVGSLLVQILGRLRAKVIASASTDEKLNTVAGLGKYPVKREHLLNSKSDDIVAKVQEITGGHGIDAVFDGIGKATFEDALKIVALKGNLVSFGNASGAVDPVNILRLGEKNIKLSRPRLFPYLNKRSDLERYSAELFNLIKNEELKILIHKTYGSLDQAKQAHDDIESRGTQGKLLIKID